MGPEKIRLELQGGCHKAEPLEITIPWEFLPKAETGHRFQYGDKALTGNLTDIFYLLSGVQRGKVIRHFRLKTHPSDCPCGQDEEGVWQIGFVSRSLAVWGMDLTNTPS